jgi:hypothetical protein
MRQPDTEAGLLAKGEPTRGACNEDVRSSSGSIIMVALASMTIATLAVSSAECADGEWRDPTGKVCRPQGVGPQPLACEPGQWWDPTANVCRSLCVGPQPLGSDNGRWWDPAANVCRPRLVSPPG